VENFVKKSRKSLDYAISLCYTHNVSKNNEKGELMKNIKREKAKVVRSWFNMFGQWCYELDNGKTIYIDYDGENVTIEEEVK